VAEADRQRSERLAQREAEYAVRRQSCANVPDIEGDPPAPPNAVGGLAFERASSLYDQRVPPPPYSGDTLDDALRWSTQVFAPWIQLHHARVTELDAIAWELIPPERAAAAAWSGHMLLEIARLVSSQPLPNEMRHDPEARRIFVGRLQDAIAP